MEERFEKSLHEANETERKVNYTNGIITVVWKPGLCRHSTRCFTQLPEVFNPRIKKWIDVNGAPQEKVIEQVRKCPSGALTYFINNDDGSE